MREEAIARARRLLDIKETNPELSDHAPYVRALAYELAADVLRAYGGTLPLPGVFVNASTPERLALKLRASLNMIGDGDWTPQDMAASRLCDAVLGLRVEEPAVEPTHEEIIEWAAENGHTYDKLEDGKVPERVLSTLREGKTLRELYNEAHAPGRVADEYVCDHGHAEYARREAALPVPAGDETEALRAAIEKLYWYARDVGARPFRDEALARVAGLEAREARLRRALEEIADRHVLARGTKEGALARAALADSGEAGS